MNENSTKSHRKTNLFNSYSSTDSNTNVISYNLRSCKKCKVEKGQRTNVEVKKKKYNRWTSRDIELLRKYIHHVSI